MSNYQALVCRVEELTPIDGADRIELATVGGEQVIVQKGLWNAGDVGILFPANILLSQEFMIKNNLFRKHPETGEPMGGYMEADRRVRFIRMKGVSSRGLFLPISSFDYLKPYDIKFTPGLEFDTINGNLICERYTTAIAVVQDKNQKVGKARSKKITNFYEIGDTPRLTTNLHKFRDGDVLVLTEKLHGTSARTGYLEEIEKPNWIDKLLSKFGYERKKNYKHISGTRRTVIGENDKTQKETYRQYFHRFFREKLRPGQIVYYEIVGPGIMPVHNAKELKDVSKAYGTTISYNYNTPSGSYSAYVYKIVDHSVFGVPIVYSWEQVVEWCEKHEVNHVPVVETLVFESDYKKETIDYVIEFADGPSTLDNSHPREGVVVQSRLGAFKFKGDTFCQLEGIMLNSSQYIDPEDQV